MKSEALVQLHVNGSAAWQVRAIVPPELCKRLRQDQLDFMQAGIVELIRETLKKPEPKQQVEEPEPVGAARKGGKR